MKTRWMIHLPGRTPFAMVGAAMDYDDALRCARLIWPTCGVD